MYHKDYQNATTMTVTTDNIAML